MRIVLRVFLIAIIALVSTGCATMGSTQKANTAGKGNMQFAIEPGSLGVVSGEGNGFIPIANIAFRYGVGERTDIGARVGMTSYELMLKHQFTPVDSSGPVISIAPTGSLFVAGIGGAGVMLGWLNVPVLIGIPMGEHQFIIGPRVLDMFFGAGAGGEGGIVNILLTGSSFGFSIQASEQFALLPEVTFMYPVVGSAGSSAGGGSFAGNFGTGAVVEFKLGLLFGGK